MEAMKSTRHFSAKKYLVPRGQTSVETSVSILLSLLLLFGIMKIFLWITQGFVIRQRNYEMRPYDGTTKAYNRISASGATTSEPRLWQEPPKLELFKND